MSICNDILEYLKENEWIDSMVALREFQTTSLAQRIYDLKLLGYQFEDQMVYYENFKGVEKHHKRYRLKRGK